MATKTTLILAIEKRLKGFKKWDADYETKISQTDKLIARKEKSEENVKNYKKQLALFTKDPNAGNLAEVAGELEAENKKLKSSEKRLNRYIDNNYTSDLNQTTRAVLLVYWNKQLSAEKEKAEKDKAEKDKAEIGLAASTAHSAGSGGHHASSSLGNSVAAAAGGARPAGSGGHHATASSAHQAGSGGQHGAASSVHPAGSGGHRTVVGGAGGGSLDAAGSHKKRKAADETGGSSGHGHAKRVELASESAMEGAGGAAIGSAADSLMRDTNQAEALAVEKQAVYARILTDFSEKKPHIISICRADGVTIDAEKYIMAILDTFQHTSLRVFEGAENKRVFKQVHNQIYEGIKARYIETKGAMPGGYDTMINDAMWTDHKKIAQYLRNADMHVENPVYHD